MHVQRKIFWLLGVHTLLASLSISTIAETDSFYESVTMDVFGHDQLYSFFNFTTQWIFRDQFNPQHYNLFPRSFGQMMQKYNVSELHFTMTQGLWRYNVWGLPHASAPTGAQLWVWFEKGTVDVDKSWLGFTNALSGLFCASLNLINKAVTVTPKLSFRPSGAVEGGKIDSSYLRYGALARENLCTENLTPWMKLLPCGSKAGPSYLLNPSRLHHSRYLSIGIHFKPVCVDTGCDVTAIQLQQHVSVVYDIRSATDEMPNFSFRSLFHRRIKPGCKLAESSILKVKMPKDSYLVPAIGEELAGYLTVDLFSLNSDTNFEVKWKKRPSTTTRSPAPISSHCYVTGLGIDGGIMCSITNTLAHNLTVVFFQVIPWFLHTQLHTLQVEVGGMKTSPLAVYFAPAKIRDTPQTLEVVLSLPADSVTCLRVDFSRGFLTWTEHPPDANHGFYVTPATITIRSSDLGSERPGVVERIYSEALLINIPVPDFSMPYNVICLVCTVIAVAFGSLHNISTRRLQKVPASQPSTLKAKLMLLKSKIFHKKEKELGQANTW